MFSRYRQYISLLLHVPQCLYMLTSLNYEHLEGKNSLIHICNLEQSAQHMLSLGFKK